MPKLYEYACSQAFGPCDYKEWKDKQDHLREKAQQCPKCQECALRFNGNKKSAYKDRKNLSPPLSPREEFEIFMIIKCDFCDQ